jgi:hypothetical protein
MVGFNLRWIKIAEASVCLIYCELDWILYVGRKSYCCGKGWCPLIFQKIDVRNLHC